MEHRTLERIIQLRQMMKGARRNGLLSLGIIAAGLPAQSYAETPSRIHVSGYGEVGSETYWGSYCGDYPTILKSDLNDNGVYEEINTYWCNAEGTRLVKSIEARDKNADGNPDEITTNEYNIQENLTKQIWDSDGDGKTNSITIYEYDNQGNVSKVTRTVDSNGDGKPDEIKTTEYIPVHIGTNSFPYMFSARETVDRNGDGVLDEITTHEYDAHGKEIKYTIDSDGDGKPNTIFTSEWDAQGHLVGSHIYDILGYPTGKINNDGTLTKENKK